MFWHILPAIISVLGTVAVVLLGYKQTRSKKFCDFCKNGTKVTVSLDDGGTRCPMCGRPDLLNKRGDA